MIENVLEFKEINKLVNDDYYIPDYQRGYRWNDLQVKDLLEDIWEFSEQDKKAEEFYCLQPVIVKDLNGKWEVIDGQQRLTTIFIILAYLGKKRFKIKYQTRTESEDFLDNLSDKRDDTNIDFHFMSAAFRTISTWFSLKEEKENNYTLKDEFYITLGKRTKVIWYEVKDGTEARDIFTRINIGKIQLNNSELVKALFLNKENFKLLPGNVTAKQSEIASEWDQMEYALQENTFWYFLNKDINSMDSRIEFIFDVIAQKPQRHSDAFFTFHYFNERLDEKHSANKSKSQDKLLHDVWENVKYHYRLLREWFEDWEFYHLIGFLLTVGEDIKVLIRDAEEKTKTQLKDDLNKRIKGHLGFQLSALSYGNEDNANIQKCLLLFNILSILKVKDSSNRFSFNRYKGDGEEKRKWSLEHIHAQNSKGLNNLKQWNTWLKDHVESLKRIDFKKHEALISEIIRLNTPELKKEQFEILFRKVLDVFLKDDNSKDELHGMSNLALLDSQSNSILNNSIFEVKRNLIVDRERKGVFIPLCTRNAFLKYYSKNAGELYYWSPTNQGDYYNEISETLKPYLPQPQVKKEN